MEPGARIDGPPPGKALLNIHRPSDYDSREDFIVWRNEKIIGNVHGEQLLQVVLDPGYHIIHAYHGGSSLIRAVLAEDRTYDIVCDTKYLGWGVGATVYLNVIKLTDERHDHIKEWLKKEKTMVLSSDPAFF